MEDPIRQGLADYRAGRLDAAAALRARYPALRPPVSDGMHSFARMLRDVGELRAFIASLERFWADQVNE